MPLEIRELVIKATIGEAARNGVNDTANNEATKLSEADVNIIVEKVLEMLKELSER